MPIYEYKVVPAPGKGTKAKGVKTAEGRFALSVEAELNRLAAGGWEYLRAELLPSEERSGLTGSVTNWRNVLVFRRAKGGAAGNASGETVEERGASAFAAASAPVPEASVPLGPAKRGGSDEDEVPSARPVHFGAPETLAEIEEDAAKESPLTSIEKVVRRSTPDVKKDKSE